MTRRLTRGLPPTQIKSGSIMRRFFIYLPLALFCAFVLLGATTQNSIGVVSLHGWNGSTIREIWLDKTTRTVPTIDYEHYQIHQGNSFSAAAYSTVGAASVWEFIVTTPNTAVWAHLIWELQGTLVTTIDMYEDATTSDDGTEITSYNRNRNSATTTAVKMYHTPTLTSDGNLIYTEKFGVSAGGFVRIGGKSRASQEIVLGQGKKYLVRVTSGTANNVIAIRARWYDTANKAD